MNCYLFIRISYNYNWSKDLQMKNRFKQISFSIIVVVSLISLIAIPAEMDTLDESLIVSIIEANYPPKAGIREGRNYTIYIIDLVYQIENPTNDAVRIDYVCAPYPFPYLRTNLDNKSIVIKLGWIIEWVAGSSVINPGIKNDSYPFAIVIEDYKEEILPVGEYSLWFDYTNCSIVPLPVIVEKLLISVTENNITYFFEHENGEDVYTLETTNYGVYSVCAVLILAIHVKRKMRGIT